ncbi:MAG: hypothetical protein ACKOW9_00040 [Candidatus Paceibacterota bacterium]
MVKKATLLIVLLSLVVLVSTVILKSNNGPSSTIYTESAVDEGKKKIFDQLLQSCWLNNMLSDSCVLDQLETTLKITGIPAAVKSTVEFRNANLGETDYSCHQIMHKIGRISTSYYKDVPSALKSGAQDCQLGYQHGVIEQSIDNAGTPALAFKVCDYVTDQTVYPMSMLAECRHAVGHGISRILDFDYVKTFKACEETTGDPADIFPCISGAMMQWSNEYDLYIREKKDPGTRLALAPYDKQWEICLRFTEPSTILGCSNFVGELVPRTVKDFKEFGSWCKDVLKYTTGCLEGVGRTIGGPIYEENNPVAIYYSPSKIKSLCDAILLTSKDDPHNCYVSAASSRANFRTDKSFVQDLCKVDSRLDCARLESGWNSQITPPSSEYAKNMNKPSNK